MKKFAVIIFAVLMESSCAQDYVQFDGNEISLDNGQIIRTIHFSGDSIYSTGLRLHSDKESIITKSRDFYFLLNDMEMSGYSKWSLAEKHHFRDLDGGKGLRIVLKDKGIDPRIQLEISYMAYPGLPVIRKWIEFTNVGSEDLKLEALHVEDLNTTLDKIHSIVYHNYARMKHLMKFIGDWDDPLVVVHHHTKQRGMALGNEGIGVLKRTAYHTIDNNIEIGLTHPDQDYPFRKWLKPGESWTSPKTFISLYSNRNTGNTVVNNEVNSFIVKHMRPRVLEIPEKPIFIYNTWNPFRTFISDSLIRQVAKSGAECGIEEFIIDDGWQVNHHRQSSIRGWGENYGDWYVDTTKFPNGLKPVFDYIKSLGMKPGLWISIGSATKDSKVFQEHPEWFVKNEKGQPGNLHFNSDTDDGFYTASFGTDWTEYIRDVILRLVREHGLTYAKLDLAVVCSPYVNKVDISGSYATDQPYYRDRPESYIVFYERLLKLFDELHEQAPELFIDCTFETAGKLQMTDYAIAKHAEGNWLSNFEEPSPVGPLRVRQMAWWRSAAVPASSLVIGNLAMDDPEFIFGLKSLIGTLPIVLGDPTRLAQEKQNEILSWASWIRSMQDKHDYMSYRKDLNGFGQPAEGMWDGWQRINFQTRDGGIFGVFRQGAREEKRMVMLDDLDENTQYLVKEAPSGKVVLKTSGKVLMEDGFTIGIEKLYDGRIFEVCREP